MNKRFPQMWDIISPHVDFSGMIVIDAGCGGGDFAVAVAQAGAKEVYAIDNNPDVAARLALMCTGVYPTVFPVQDDINGWGIEREDYRPRTDSRKTILSCFSVLPYLKDPVKTLNVFREMATIVLLEVQLIGDGPGTMNKQELTRLLWSIFEDVECLGKTIAKKDKDYGRHIWICR